jgi:hypothetical protein
LIKIGAPIACPTCGSHTRTADTAEGWVCLDAACAWSWPETRRRVGRRQAIPDRTRSPGKRWVEAELLDQLGDELLDELGDATGLRTG